VSSGQLANGQWPGRCTMQTTRIDHSFDQIWIRKWLLPGYYLVIPSISIWCLQKNLRFANRKTNLRPISDYGAADLISPPPKPEIHLAEFAKSSTCLCIFNIFELNDLCRVPGKYIVETRWNSWRFGDVSSRYSSSPRIAVTPRKKNLHRPGVQPPHATVPAARIDLPLPKVTLCAAMLAPRWSRIHVFYSFASCDKGGSCPNVD